MKNSTTSICELPPTQQVIKICRALALSDAILMPEWEYRYFSFNSNWDGNGKEMMASMRDGSGGEYFIHFSNAGAVGKVFQDVEVEKPDEILSRIPRVFGSFKKESAFNLEQITFCFWFEKNSKCWISVPEDIQQPMLLNFIIGNYSYYHEWAESYYEKSIDKKLLQKIFRTLNFDNDDIASLNPDITIDDLAEDFVDIFGAQS